MTTRALREAEVWLRQAHSDARTAAALLLAAPPMQVEDIGCHVAALCSQAIEKSLKGYLLLNGVTPAMNHRPDKYLPNLLTKDDPLLRHREHHAYLSRLFDTGTKAVVKLLFDLTPGGLGSRTDVQNTEYPWTESGEWRHTPFGAAVFRDGKTLKEWVDTAQRVRNTLAKLWISVDRASLG